MPPQQEQEQESSVIPGDVNSFHQLVGLPEELLNYTSSSSGCNNVDDGGRGTNSSASTNNNIRKIID